MNDFTLDYLKSTADQNNIETYFDYVGSNTTTACSAPKYRRIYVNMNYHKQHEIPFQFAHEIGHVLCNHIDNPISCFSTVNYGIELEANIEGIKLLMPIYTFDKEPEQLSLIHFMNYFCIPGHLETVVQNQFMKFVSKNM